MGTKREARTYESFVCVPGVTFVGEGAMIDGGKAHGNMTVGDLVDFAEYLSANDVDRDALVYDTQFLRPQNILGIQVLIERRERDDG